MAALIEGKESVILEINVFESERKPYISIKFGILGLLDFRCKVFEPFF